MSARIGLKLQGLETLRNLHDLPNTKGDENLVQRYELCYKRKIRSFFTGGFKYTPIKKLTSNC